MLDASRTNETAAAEKISKLQEEKKVLQVWYHFLVQYFGPRIHVIVSPA